MDGPEPEAIQVHQANVEGARIQALSATYLVLRQIVGTRCFQGLALNFVRAQPSRSPDLNFSGGRFPAWLRCWLRGRETFRALPYLPDLARLERAVNAVYYAADSAPALCLASPWPVDEIWRRHQRGIGLESVPFARCYAVIAREEGRVTVNSLPRAQWVALRAQRRCGEMTA